MKLYGDGFGNLFLRNIIDISILIFISIIISFLFSLIYGLVTGEYIFLLYSNLLINLLITALIIALLPTINNFKKDVQELIRGNYEGSTKATFLFPQLLPGLGFILAIFIFLNVSEKQLEKIIERKVSPYENNILIVSKLGFNKISNSFSNDIQGVENINQDLLKINFKPDKFAANAIKLMNNERIELEFENQLIGNSILYYKKILDFYNYLFVIFTLISILTITALITFLIYNIRSL